jgi:hypothetical protein
MIRTSNTGGLGMCYERWMRRRRSERSEESGWLWDEFERTEPLKGVETEEEEAEIRLERDSEPIATER